MRFIICLMMYMLSIKYLYSETIINAYWYNLPIDYTIINNDTISLNSFLELEVDLTFSDDIIVEAFDEYGCKKFECFISKKIFSQTKKNISPSGKIYRLFKDVPYLENPPNYLIIKRSNGCTIKKIDCFYSVFAGNVNCKSNYSKLFIGLVPNDFEGPDLIFKVQKNNSFSIHLPKRIYKYIYAFADTYGKSTLENWFFDFDGNNDKNVNFEITNGEIYNLQAWRNKGGGNSIFIVFRPMAINEVSFNTIEIDNTKFREINYNLSLDKDNIKVSINNNYLKINSVQSFYETGNKDYAIKGYIVQAEYDNKYLGDKVLNIEFNYHGLRGISKITIK